MAKEDGESHVARRRIAISLQQGLILGNTPEMMAAAVRIRREFGMPDDGFDNILERYEWHEQQRDFDHGQYIKRIEELFLASKKFKLGVNAMRYLPNYISLGELYMPDLPLPIVKDKRDKYGQLVFTMTYSEHHTKNEIVDAYLHNQRLLIEKGEISKRHKRDHLLDYIRLKHAYRAIELRDSSPTMKYKDIAQQLNDEFEDDKIIYSENEAKKLISQFRPILGQ